MRFDIEQHNDIVRLTVTHEAIADASEYEAASAGWAAVISNLKSLLEKRARVTAGAVGDARGAARRTDVALAG